VSDGQRATITGWDETTRPTGPPRDLTRTYSEAETARGQHLVEVHDHLRGELAQLRDLMDNVLRGALSPRVARSHINTMTMRQNNWTLGTYCQSYCRLVTTHHTFEDIAMLRQISAADPRLTPVAERLAEEHVAIHGLIEEVDRALVAFVADPSTGDDLRAAVDLLSDSLLSHLSYEECELVEPLSRMHIW
jgi:hemerythrin-like domain-containing protein